VTLVLVRRLVVLAAAIAAIVLALVVLIGSPSHPLDLLAGAAMAAGAGLAALLL
jgi:hypothetical protein